MERSNSVQKNTALEEYHCSDCMIHVASADNICPKCGEIMWKVSQLKGMGQLFTWMWGFGTGFLALFFLLGLVMLFATFNEGDLMKKLAGIYVFGAFAFMGFELFRFSRRMSVEGIFDREIKKKARRVFLPLIVIGGLFGFF